MNKLFKKIDRIRGSGTAMLNLRPGHPYFHLDGQIFPVVKIGIPELKCPLVLTIEGQQVTFTIDDVH
ncbi:hypothetical protein DF947_06300 [Pedobacter paludis]|uniref:Uncharacterized protein n=1 Tax=Pedobacter paludis TaxID=2203212 RepID=A0A317F488_9SPHI|nr:hypothetical protein DF947_06300 [Pedobacter paludis]